MNTGRLIAAMIEYLEGNIHEIEHMLKVYGYAKTIGEMEKLDADLMETLETAAIVHDIGIPRAMEKYGNDAGPYQEELGPCEAEKMLGMLGCEPARIERVCYLVGHHHTYSGVDGMDYRILLEADFLVNAANKRLPKEAVAAARENFFRTKSGIEILNKVFGL